MKSDDFAAKKDKKKRAARLSFLHGEKGCVDRNFVGGDAHIAPHDEQTGPDRTL
jgi:hypothetical protein